ncbi:BgTH12-01474 [Blumeria graminis f. sp. triticale]|uniref:Bgt-1237 n=3 Tax=Blumeria graminis TaxID=34373 RepID=A0A381L717_BLUGR|nr:hypothetical protein BGT96224_1237 [Blumeria graminis f. sp. tritici 96224]CAD6501220.1 BgTH12-01474 [Blumeria graminis f. sp. triticale]VDB83637.1 Bgt-1237 [Blumeria graminis f. sp. tritici]
MAPQPKTTAKGGSGTPYQLNLNQVSKATESLLAHIQATQKSKLGEEKSTLLDEDPLEDSPIWFQLTTKLHITANKRLKPIKISLPHPLHTHANSSICLITADPQRAVKDLISHPSFPTALSGRITRVVGLHKLKSKWSQYEAQRKLYAEHDIFLADDRVVTALPAILGKTFYKSTAKRPIPIAIQQQTPKVGGVRVKKVKGDPPRELANVTAVVKEIEKALGSAAVYLSPSTITAVRIGFANWSADKLQENIKAVTDTLIEGVVAKKWRGVKSLHIKGAETASLPIWLAEEIWTDEKDVKKV